MIFSILWPVADEYYNNFALGRRDRFSVRTCHLIIGKLVSFGMFLIPVVLYDWY
jgi:hypothetical protein